MSRKNCPNLNNVPNQVCDYMRSVNTRFNEICDLYLKGLSIDDLRYLCPEDLINLVPPEQYSHKLLMTIMVRRYLYPNSNKKDCDNDDDDEKDKESCDGKCTEKC